MRVLNLPLAAGLILSLAMSLSAAEFCQTCHGAQGQGSTELNSPALSGLAPWYLERQLLNFKRGVRGSSESDIEGRQMAGATSGFTESQLIDISRSVHEWATVTVSEPVKGDIRKGEAYYHHNCGACHGPGARGNEQMSTPALAGMQSWYLLAQMEKFYSGIRGTHPDDRFGAQMVFIVQKLPDRDQWREIAAYVSSAGD